MEIERHDSTDLVTMLTEQFFFPFSYHPVRMVKFQIGDPTHVLLVIGRDEKVREEPLL